VAAPAFTRYNRRASLSQIVAYWWAETGWTQSKLLDVAIIEIIHHSAKKPNGWRLWSLDKHRRVWGHAHYLLHLRAEQAMSGSGVASVNSLHSYLGDDLALTAVRVERLAVALGVAAPSWLDIWKTNFPPAAETPDPSSEEQLDPEVWDADLLDEMLDRYPGGFGHEKRFKGFCDEFRGGARGSGKGLADEGIRSRIRTLSSGVKKIGRKSVKPPKNTG
jgi:hypothetical protein